MNEAETLLWDLKMLLGVEDVTFIPSAQIPVSKNCCFECAQQKEGRPVLPCASDQQNKSDDEHYLALTWGSESSQ